MNKFIPSLSPLFRQLNNIMASSGFCVYNRSCLDINKQNFTQEEPIWIKMCHKSQLRERKVSFLRKKIVTIATSSIKASKNLERKSTKFCADEFMCYCGTGIVRFSVYLKFHNKDFFLLFIRCLRHWNPLVEFPSENYKKNQAFFLFSLIVTMTLELLGKLSAWFSN